MPFLDVPGSEVWWVKEKEDRVLWQPMDDEDFMFRRALCGGKPLCFLMDAPFDHFTKEMTEMYFQRSLAYGALPSFFTWHGVSTFGNNIYFKRPDCYERDRPLFKKYVPLCKTVSEAGWQPINAITESATEGVITEQFGELGHGGVYATVFNLTDKPVRRTTALSIPCRSPRRCASATSRRSPEKAPSSSGTAITSRTTPRPTSTSPRPIARVGIRSKADRDMALL